MQSSQAEVNKMSRYNLDKAITNAKRDFCSKWEDEVDVRHHFLQGKIRGQAAPVTAKHHSPMSSMRSTHALIGRAQMCLHEPPMVLQSQ